MKNSTIRLSLAMAFVLSLQNYAFADNANKATNQGDSNPALADSTNGGGESQ